MKKTYLTKELLPRFIYMAGGGEVQSEGKPDKLKHGTGVEGRPVDINDYKAKGETLINKAKPLLDTAQQQPEKLMTQEEKEKTHKTIDKVVRNAVEELRTKLLKSGVYQNREIWNAQNISETVLRYVKDFYNDLPAQDQALVRAYLEENPFECRVSPSKHADIDFFNVKISLEEGFFYVNATKVS